MKVIKRLEDKIEGVIHIPMYECECACGNKIVLAGRDVHKTKTCGHCKKDADPIAKVQKIPKE